MTEAVQNFLKDAAERCRSTERVEISVRSLLAWWGHAARNDSVVEEIVSDLAEHGLTTVPDLAYAGRTLEIVFVPESTGPQSAPSDAPGGPPPGPGGPDAVDDEAPVRVSLRVAELPSATGGVTTVSVDDPLSQAETTMLSDDFSQLAVVQDGRLRGALTWDSIRLAKARGKHDLRSALDPLPEVLKCDDDLLKQAPRIWRNGFAFVENGDRDLVGIVTLADLARQFVDLANPFVLLSEIEQRLRRLVRKICTLEEMRQKARYPNKTNGADDLMFGDYKKIFEDGGLFGRCGWADIDQKVFVDRLDRVRIIRNEVMHFSAEAVREEHTRALNAFIKFIKGLDGS
ncbi:CBS domain-containing protein [Actinomadura litoris]|uniref:CBS domain-containing protein n=1 Tax=Actinomadura litoris TaxID=2678616 RepID=UPI001FA6B0B6|nr:CBS domain-containing protein [Actinomadura litoris]